MARHAAQLGPSVLASMLCDANSAPRNDLGVLLSVSISFVTNAAMSGDR